ncbi:hypothetical protein BS47DRAFT_314642 [Hydnum rufescens UP504]|uniref:Uncharacterized protein n=1 Tax=Hydnum rufescens UP504 TaxID=1448309 RepID=A0A9P6DRB2_9AGAM|nr:hypothetical protein BS47DRAFT_314642 [Hydnum rufescens UP504]
MNWLMFRRPQRQPSPSPERPPPVPRKEVLTFTNRHRRLRTLLSPLITIIQPQGPIHRCCGTWMLAQRDQLLIYMKD